MCKITCPVYVYHFTHNSLLIKPLSICIFNCVVDSIYIDRKELIIQTTYEVSDIDR